MAIALAAGKTLQRAGLSCLWRHFLQGICMEREDQLYAPVKALLEAQGFEVKGEVGAADVVAVRGAEPPVIVELKLKFSLSLFHQAIARLAVTDHVYVAGAAAPGAAGAADDEGQSGDVPASGAGPHHGAEDGRAEVHCDPGPYAPRKSKKKTGRGCCGSFRPCAAIPTRAAPPGTGLSPPIVRTRWPVRRIWPKPGPARVRRSPRPPAWRAPPS